MSYQDITLEEMDQFLRQRRFYPVDLYFRRRPVKEWVYERKLPRHANHYVRVYTSIQRYGRNSDTARDVGKDAIRVQVIYRDNKGETLVSFPKRVNRVTTWANNLNDRLQEIAATLPEVKRDSRGEPMTLRQKKGNLFWGSRDYPAYKETQRYGAEDSQEIKEYITSIHDGEFFWRNRWDDLEFKLQTLPMEIFEEYKDPDNADGAWMDSPVSSRRLEDTLSQFRWQGAGYPPVVLALDKNGNYDIIDGYHRLNALQILDYDTVEAWVGQPLSSTSDAESEDSKKGVAVMVHDGATSTYPKVWGTVYFEEVTGGITISYNIHGLYDGLHGFHIHQYGDLTDGCTSACAHFNPDNTTHGGLNTKIRHFGDLGNIESKDRLAQGSLFLADGRLDSSKYGILGRMIIVHADQDDLGKGGLNQKGEVIDEAVHKESLKTGNAGKRLACGVIGLADPKIFGLEAEVQFQADDNYDATYGKKQAKIRRRLKNKIMKQNIMGTKANKWSARKSQELKRQYEAACGRAGLAPYKGKKTSKQQDLSDWSNQGWRTASGKKSSVTGEPYFPAKAVAALKKKNLYAKAKRQKVQANKENRNARYSDDIREVVGMYRAEDYTDHEIEVIMLFDLLTNNGLVDNMDIKNNPYRGILTDYEPLDIMKATTEYMQELVFSTKSTSSGSIEDYLVKLETDMNQAVGWRQMAESCLKQVEYYQYTDANPMRFRIFPNLLSRGIVEQDSADNLVDQLEASLVDILYDRPAYNSINFVNI